MRYREFVLSLYGVIKLKSLGYMRQRSIAGCYQNNVAWLYQRANG
ncbi:hypothetical protein [Symbiopectobacterium purcellii]